MKDRRIFLALIALLVGCNKGSNDAVETVGSTQTQEASFSTRNDLKPVQISIVCPADLVELSEAIKSGADSAKQTLQTNEGVKITTTWRPYTTQAQLQDALQSSVLSHDHAVLLRPNPSYSIATQLKELSDAGIKVVTLGVDVPKNLRTIFCGIPDAKLGNRLGYTIATRLKAPTNVGVVEDAHDSELMAGLQEIAKNYPNLKLVPFKQSGVGTDNVLTVIHRHPEFKTWVVFQSSVLANPEEFSSLDPKKVEIYTLGCWPRQLPMLESGLVKPLSLPSYELGYLALCRAVDAAALRRKTDDTYMIATPLVDKTSVRSYAVTLRRWGFSNVASRYLETVRSHDSVK